MSIEIKNLTFKYSVGTPFEITALNNINLTIKKGEFVGLIGHTGSGKSTLIQHLNALMKPTSGEIYIDGENIFADKTKLKQLRKRTGLVFQYPEHQLFEMTVYKDVSFGPTNFGFSKEETDIRVREALELVGIDETLYEKSPFELSGGQKRRVAIAGVLATTPDILILDEPTAGLDPRGRDEILTKIKEMHQKLKITVILVSHSMEDIAKLAEFLVVMHRGKIAYTGTAMEIFMHSDALEKIGLASPQVRYLMQSLKEKGFDVAEDIFTVEAATKQLAMLLK